MTVQISETDKRFCHLIQDYTYRDKWTHKCNGRSSFGRQNGGYCQYCGKPLNIILQDDNPS